MKKLRAIMIILVIAGTMGFILVRNKAVIDQRSQVKETAKSVVMTVQPAAFRNIQVDNERIGAELTAAEVAYELRRPPGAGTAGVK